MIKILNELTKLTELRLDFNYSSFKDEDVLELCEGISKNVNITKI